MIGYYKPIIVAALIQSKKLGWVNKKNFLAISKINWDTNRKMGHWYENGTQKGIWEIKIL